MKITSEILEKIGVAIMCGIIPGIAVIVSSFRIKKNNEVTLISRNGFTSKWRRPKTLKKKDAQMVAQADLIFGITILIFSMGLLLLELFT